MRNNTVYIYRNNINGKLYIGQTTNMNKRCKKTQYKGCTYFYNAINKYGWENFEQIIIKTDLSDKEADELEILLIKFFDTTNSNYGYNLSSGGDKKCVLVGDKNGFYHKKHSEGSVLKMKEKKIGGNNPLAKPVICVTTNEIFPSAREASEWCGASRQHINRVCRGERKHTGVHPETNEPLEWRYYSNEF